MHSSHRGSNVSSVRLMSFNIRHGEGMDGKIDLGRIAAVIRESGADIIGLQEVDRHKGRSGFNDQIVTLANELGMEWRYAPSIEQGFSQYGNGMLSKHPIIAERVDYLPGVLERRSMLQTMIQLTAGQELMHKDHGTPTRSMANIQRGTTQQGVVSLLVVNTHLGVRQEEKERQFPLLMDTLRELSCPAVIMGDFNMEIADPLLRQLSHIWHKAALPPNVPTLVNGKEIDHLFVHLSANSLQEAKAYRSIKAWTLPTDASDHHPVIAEIPLDMLQSQ